MEQKYAGQNSRNGDAWILLGKYCNKNTNAAQFKIYHTYNCLANPRNLCICSSPFSIAQFLQESSSIFFPLLCLLEQNVWDRIQGKGYFIPSIFLQKTVVIKIPMPHDLETLYVQSLSKRYRHIAAILTLKVLNFWKCTSCCSLNPLWSGMREVVPARTSPTLHPPSPPTVRQLSRLAL